MQRETGTGAKVENTVITARRIRLHVYTVRLELVCSAIGIVEHRIVEVPVELQQGVRNGHGDVLFVHLHELALIVVCHLDGGIEVLGGCDRTCQQG